MKRKSEAIFFRKYLLRINRLINQEHIWCFTGLIKLLSVKKDTQKYGNADGRNILCINAPEKAFPYFLEHKNIDATLLYCNNCKLPCYKWRESFPRQIIKCPFYFWKRDGTGAKKLVGNMKSFGDFDALFISVFSVA